MSPWVKICATTTREDALLAADAGADAVGFVFAPSPRRVTPEQVAAIVPQLPAFIEKIGVFVDATFEQIVAIVEGAGLTGAQLHFESPPDLPARLRARFGPALRILGVMHFEAEQTAIGQGSGFSPYPPVGPFSDPNIDAILVDSGTTQAVGGTGQRFDWAAASKTLFQSTKARGQRLVAAGGLTPENVVEAIAMLRPWGVDVASGVEIAPGQKDAAKVRAFIANARQIGHGK